jgi:hypothetical protein
MRISALQEWRSWTRMRAVRWFFVIVGLLLCATSSRAQEQENKLVDRLLRPNMELSNPAQNQKFTAVEGVSVEKKFQTKEFSSASVHQPKSFWGARSFLSKTFGSGKYARAEAVANARANAELAFASTEFQTKNSTLAKRSSFAGKSSAVRDYAGNRPFRGAGTRQKILDEQNQAHPMSIDDVRELLNKGHR